MQETESMAYGKFSTHKNKSGHSDVIYQPPQFYVLIKDKPALLQYLAVWQREPTYKPNIAIPSSR